MQSPQAFGIKYRRVKFMFFEYSYLLLLSLAAKVVCGSIRSRDPDSRRKSKCSAIILCYVFRNFHLRNRKHFPCFYRVIETRVEVWENEECCGNTSRRRVFPQLFRVLPNFHECFYYSIETRRKCFLFFLENSLRKITKNEEHLID